MACRLFGAKPLAKQMPANFQYDACEQISVKLESEFTKMYLKLSSAKMAAILADENFKYNLKIVKMIPTLHVHCITLN